MEGLSVPRYIVTLWAADGRKMQMSTDARTDEGACARAQRIAERSDPRDESGKPSRWLPVSVMPDRYRPARIAP